MDCGLEKLYSNWEDGNKVIFRFIDRGWEIHIERKHGKYTFGNGWRTFAQETGLQTGDTLVLFKTSALEENTINVCIFKSEDNNFDHEKGKVLR